MLVGRKWKLLFRLEAVEVKEGLHSSAWGGFILVFGEGIYWLLGILVVSVCIPSLGWGIIN